MQLEPCAQCRRHVASDAPSCPFCAAPRASTSRSVLAVGGRLSRAAVFSLAACSGGVQQTQVVPPPPPPPTDAALPADTTQFATPPPDGTQPTAGVGIVQGQVVFGRFPRAGVHIALRGAGVARHTQTGDDGSFTFTDVPVGSYEVVLQPEHPNENEQIRNINVVAGQPVRVRYTIAEPVQDRGPCCKPYGAPPARRRMV